MALPLGDSPVTPGPRFIFLNCFKHTVHSREQGLLSIFKEPWPTKLILKKLSSTTKILLMQKKFLKKGKKNQKKMHDCENARSVYFLLS